MQVLVILVCGVVALLMIAALLVQFGCYVTGTEVPSFGRALAAVLLFMVGGFFVNMAILGCVAFAVRALGDDLDERQAALAVKWGSRLAQMAADVFVGGAIFSMFLNNVTFWRGVAVSCMVSVGMVALGLAVAMTVGGMAALQQ